MKSEGKQTAHLVQYREWLVPSFASFVTASLLLPSFFLVFLPINALVGLMTGLAATLAIWAGMLSSSAHISIVNDELIVAKAHIPIKYLATPKEIAPENRFFERGPNLDSRAFVRFQLGIKGLIRIENLDENDPTPYWLISTRHPERLALAISKV